MTTDTTNKSPGDMLREARRERGLTLEDAAAMTRIPEPMLGHLERNRFDEYTAEVFTRGHLRNYARELGLDEQEVIESYDHHNGHRSSRLTIPRLDDSEDAAHTSSAERDLDSGEIASESAARKRDTEPSEESSGVDWSGRLSVLTRQVRMSHVVAIGIVLVFLFVVVNFLTGSRATAKDPAKFEESSQEVEKAADDARWALEQPADESEKSDDE